MHDADDADEPGEGDDLHDLGAARPVPDPMDRTWRHPSEMGRPDVPPVSAPARPRRLHRPRTRTWSLALGAAVAGSAITVGALAAAGTFNSSTTTVVSTPGLGAPSNGSTLAAAASEVRPAVVSILARDAAGARRGSGVCIRHGTDIVTAAAIVGTAKTVTVTDSNNVRSTGTVVGTDATSGLALVRITGDISTATLAHQPPASGDAVYAIGDDYVDTGIVTARDVWLAQPSAVTLRGLLGTNLGGGSDAVGGAVVDQHGDIAGVMIRDDGTAVPIAYAERVVDSLRESGHVDHGWIGVSGVDNRDQEAVVMKVDRGSPAAAAGIAPGDGILAADGHALLGIAELKAAVTTRWPGDVLSLQVQHGATVRTIVLHVASALSAPPPPTKGGGLRL